MIHSYFHILISTGNKDNIKIEINYVLRNHILNVEVNEVNIGADSFSINMLNKIELYATKITALLNRGAVRDLFDINNMIENKIISTKDKSLLKKCVIVYSIITNNEDELFRYDNIEKINIKEVKSDLYPVLRKRNLFYLDEAKDKVISYLDSLFVLTNDEKEFIIRFYRGNLDLSLLFEEKEIITRLKSHPMIIWKLNHIKKYLQEVKINE